jgi:hypothetical protein
MSTMSGCATAQTAGFWCAALGIEPVGYRDIQRLWLRDR